MIKFRFQPTFEDYRRLNRHVVWRQFRFLICLAALLFVLFLAQPFIFAGFGPKKDLLEFYRDGWMVLILPGLVSLLLLSNYVGTRKRWDAEETIRATRDYEIDESGVRATGDSFAGFLDWRHIVQAEEGSGYFFLRTMQNQFYYFPVSVVPDPQTLRALLAAKVVPPKPQSKLFNGRVWAIWAAILLVAIIIASLGSPARK